MGGIASGIPIHYFDNPYWFFLQPPIVNATIPDFYLDTFDWMLHKKLSNLNWFSMKLVTVPWSAMALLDHRAHLDLV